MSKKYDIDSRMSKKYDYLWEPKSRQREDEYLVTQQEMKLARGEVIGVFINEPNKSYTKWIWKKIDGVYKIYPLWSIWNHSDEAVMRLDMDLKLGLEVLVYSIDKKWHVLNETTGETGPTQERFMVIYGISK